MCGARTTPGDGANAANARHLDAYRSGVSKSDDWGTPISRHALRKNVTFSICLNASFEVLIFLTAPGLITFIALHSVVPSLSCGPNASAKASPVRLSIHAWALASSPRSVCVRAAAGQGVRWLRAPPQPPPSQPLHAPRLHQQGRISRLALTVFLLLLLRKIMVNAEADAAPATSRCGLKLLSLWAEMRIGKERVV